jgi:hypothetical protein
MLNNWPKRRIERESNINTKREGKGKERKGKEVMDNTKESIGEKNLTKL